MTIITYKTNNLIKMKIYLMINMIYPQYILKNNNKLSFNNQKKN